MRIARALHDMLAPVVEAGEATWSDLVETLLFEVPDEAMREFAEIAAPVEVDLDPPVAGLMEEMAEAFGMTPLGLSVLMGRVLGKTLEIKRRIEEHERTGT